MLYCRFHRVKIKFLIDFYGLNYRIYPQTTSQGRLLKRSINTIARRQLSCETILK